MSKLNNSCCVAGREQSSNQRLKSNKESINYFVLLIYYFNFAMKKINLKGISEILSEKELKNVMGGSGSCSTCSGQSCTQLDGFSPGHCLQLTTGCPCSAA